MNGRPLGRLQDFQQLLLNEPAQLGGVTHLVAGDALPDALQNFGRGLNTDIGADQRVFQLVEKIGVDLFAAGQRVFKPGDQPGPRFRHAAF